MSLYTQILYLFILAIPVACISWTITHEEVFKEPREFCELNSRKNKLFLLRKFFYMLTCEYCLSHYVTIVVLVLTKFYLLYADWRGYVIAGFSIVWIANLYMSLFYLLRQGIKKEKVTIEEIEENNKQEN
ncbi:MAG TPA: hypothetical protein VHQ93_06270 [Chitinophagaceae bacterium]|jgi:hypothetical protein|nr:hypothetical protein [Chitinophagaceae bacterium]